MFDRDWIANEIAGLEKQLAETIVLLHQIEGALKVLQQMEQQLGGVEESTPLPLLDDVLASAGLTVEEISPLDYAGAMSFDVKIPNEEKESESED